MDFTVNRTQDESASFEALTAVKNEVDVLRFVTPCSVVIGLHGVTN
jgi:hypothetical protein